MPAPVRPRRHHARGEQPFDLGREKKPVALPGPVRAGDAEAVAPELQPSLALIPQRDGKLPAQPLEHPFLMLFPQVRNDFGVAVGDEAMPARFQLGPPFDVIEQFAVEDDEDAPVLIGDRLLSIRQADNAQPSRGQRHPGSLEEALFVRAAMQKCARHFLMTPSGNGPLPGQINDACNSTHDVYLLVRRCACQATVFL